MPELQLNEIKVSAVLCTDSNGTYFFVLIEYLIVSSLG